MKYRFLVLNRSMNVVHCAKFDIVSFHQLQDKMILLMKVFWRFKYLDDSVSFRLIPDIDKTGDLFDENNNPLIF